MKNSSQLTTDEVDETIYIKLLNEFVSLLSKYTSDFEKYDSNNIDFEFDFYSEFISKLKSFQLTTDEINTFFQKVLYDGKNIISNFNFENVTNMSDDIIISEFKKFIVFYYIYTIFSDYNDISIKSDKFDFVSLRRPFLRFLK